MRPNFSCAPDPPENYQVYLVADHSAGRAGDYRQAGKSTPLVPDGNNNFGPKKRENQ
jgi:hypothetical protein